MTRKGYSSVFIFIKWTNSKASSIGVKGEVKFHFKLQLWSTLVFYCYSQCQVSYFNHRNVKTSSLLTIIFSWKKTYVHFPQGTKTLTKHIPVVLEEKCSKTLASISLIGVLSFCFPTFKACGYQTLILEDEQTEQNSLNYDYGWVKGCSHVTPKKVKGHFSILAWLSETLKAKLISGILEKRRSSIIH